MMQFVVAGNSVAAGFAACCAAALQRDLHIDLHLAAVPQDTLEPILLDCLPAPLRDVAGAMAVAAWTSFASVHSGSQRIHDGELVLIDPVQVGIELDALSGRITVHRGAAGARSAPVAPDLDLTVPVQEQVKCWVLSASSVRALTVPVIAEFDVSSHDDVFVQYFPLGDGQVLVRQCHGGPVVADDGIDPAAIMARCGPLQAAASGVARLLA